SVAATATIPLGLRSPWYLCQAHSAQRVLLRKRALRLPTFSIPKFLSFRFLHPITQSVKREALPACRALSRRVLRWRNVRGSDSQRNQDNSTRETSNRLKRAARTRKSTELCSKAANLP